jgi:hypothetical protein
MIVRRGFPDLVPSLGCEFEMVGLLGMSEDNAVEAIVVFKSGKRREAKPCGIHLGNDCQMVRWSGDAEDRTSVHSFASSHLLMSHALWWLILIRAVCASRWSRIFTAGTLGAQRRQNHEGR